MVINMNAADLDTTKAYTTFQEKVTLPEGLIPNECCGLAFACFVYQKETNGRKVLVANLTDSEKERTLGTSMMGLMALEAFPGSLLEIAIEGVDDKARALQDELRRGLSVENYLWEKFRPLYEKIRPRY